mmetsp:Transcript_76152/g.236402  ORF Transcript_76152/g.236402 Transcript_76152/m.236402 type:complete len:359 (+) Transcript_76152:1-1077(+)
MGFEHQAFCGGAFVPLVAVLQRGAAGPVDRVCSRTFEVRLRLALVPLDLLRTSYKLEPAELSGAARPQSPRGHVLIGLRLTLYEPPLALYLAEPLCLPPQQAASLGQVSDPMSVLKAAAAAVARAGRALNVEPWAVALDELREDPVHAFTLFLWWTCTSLLAPIWAWPVLLVAVLPLLARRVRTTSDRAFREEPLRLYSDELADPHKDLDATKRVKRAVKGAVGVQLTIMQFVDKLNGITSQVERLKFLVSLGDGCQSALWGTAALAAAAFASLALRLLLLAFGGDGPRYLAWLVGCYALLPRRGREAFCALARAAKRTRELMGDRVSKRISCLWRRIPDGVEACHLGLFERYVLIGP